MVGERNGGEARARYSAFRLVVSALTFVGFVAMHGLASAGGDGSHCAAPLALISSVDTAVHGTDHGSAHGMTGSRAAATAGPHAGPAVHPAAGPVMTAAGSSGGGGDEAVAGCLLALLGGLIALVLRVLRVSVTGTSSSSARSAPAWARVARAPPRPLFVSLCVFRL